MYVCGRTNSTFISKVIIQWADMLNKVGRMLAGPMRVGLINLVRLVAVVVVVAPFKIYFSLE